MIIGSLALAALIVHLVFGRTMVLVHGVVKQRRAGLIRAIYHLLRMYWCGYSNTLFVNPDVKVKTRHEDREMRKNKPGKHYMIFEVEL